MESAAVTPAILMTGWIGIVVLVFFFVLFVLWIILPFAVFGTKPRLDSLIVMQRELLQETATQNRLLEDQNKVLLALLTDLRNLPKKVVDTLSSTR